MATRKRPTKKRASPAKARKASPRVVDDEFVKAKAKAAKVRAAKAKAKVKAKGPAKKAAKAKTKGATKKVKAKAKSATNVRAKAKGAAKKPKAQTKRAVQKTAEPKAQTKGSAKKATRKQILAQIESAVAPLSGLSPQFRPVVARPAGKKGQPYAVAEDLRLFLEATKEGLESEGYDASFRVHRYNTGIVHADLRVPLPEKIRGMRDIKPTIASVAEHFYGRVPGEFISAGFSMRPGLLDFSKQASRYQLYKGQEIVGNTWQPVSFAESNIAALEPIIENVGKYYGDVPREIIVRISYRPEGEKPKRVRRIPKGSRKAVKPKRMKKYKFPGGKRRAKRRRIW